MASPPLAVPGTTHRQTVTLIVPIRVHVLVVVVHVPVMRVTGVVLRGTPPVAVVANVVEVTIVPTVAARQSRKQSGNFHQL